MCHMAGYISVIAMHAHKGYMHTGPEMLLTLVYSCKPHLTIVEYTDYNYDQDIRLQSCTEN